MLSILYDNFNFKFNLIFVNISGIVYKVFTGVISLNSVCSDVNYFINVFAVY